MTRAAILTISFRSFWRCSTGKGVAASLDSLCARDHLGLPIVPGRTIKGVLRDACARAEKLRAIEPGWTRTLFGEAGYDDPTAGEEDPAPWSGTDPGCLAVGSAVLPDGLRNWFAAAADNERSRVMKARLFETLGQTAIEEASGTALNKSLRVTEVAVPTSLAAGLDFVAPHPDAATFAGVQPEAGWFEALRSALPLVEGFGGYRTRGLGRAVVNLEGVA